MVKTLWRKPNPWADIAHHESLVNASSEQFVDEIQRELSTERHIRQIVDGVLTSWQQNNKPAIIPMIEESVAKSGRDALFSDDLEKSTLNLEDDTLIVATVVDYLLGGKWCYTLTREERYPLLVRRHKMLKEQSNPIDIVTALYPDIVSLKLLPHQKVECITKISILMMILPVPKIDQFIEQHILIEQMLQGSTYSTTINKVLWSVLLLDMKNDGIGYNYRVDLLMDFLMKAKAWLARTPDRAGNNTVTDYFQRLWAKNNAQELSYFRERHDTLQEVMIALKQLWLSDQKLYQSYSYHTKKFFESQPDLDGSHYEYFDDLTCLSSSVINHHEHDIYDGAARGKLPQEAIDELLLESHNRATSLAQYPKCFQEVVAKEEILTESFVLREIKFNPIKNEYVWIKAWLAIMVEDWDEALWSWAKAQLENTGYRLPNDTTVDSFFGNRLHPQESEFDAMIVRLPWWNEKKKGLLFFALMWLSPRNKYRTNTVYGYAYLHEKEIPQYIVYRGVFGWELLRNRWNAEPYTWRVRGVRSL